MLQYDIVYNTAITYQTRLDYTLLYYTIICYSILYFTVLRFTILYYTILYYTILYYTILYYTIFYDTGTTPGTAKSLLARRLAFVCRGSLPIVCTIYYTLL